MIGRKTPGTTKLEKRAKKLGVNCEIIYSRNDSTGRYFITRINDKPENGILLGWTLAESIADLPGVIDEITSGAWLL